MQCRSSLPENSALQVHTRRALYTRHLSPATAAIEISELRMLALPLQFDEDVYFCFCASLSKWMISSIASLLLFGLRTEEKSDLNTTVSPLIPIATQDLSLRPLNLAMRLSLSPDTGQQSPLRASVH